jgi:hypothetical protein
VTIQLFKGKGIQPWYLRAVSDNGQVLVTSEGYFSKWNAKRAARKNFAGVLLVDLTEKPYKRFGASA